MSAWEVPRGAAKVAPLADADELLRAWFRIVRMRLEATLGERRGSESPAQQRAMADRQAQHVARRLAATPEPPALAVAVARLGLADPIASAGVLLGYELDDDIARLLDEAGGPCIAGIAAARADDSAARALDAIDRELVSRRLASLAATAEPARRWLVRADRRWWAIAAGRLDPPPDLPLRVVATPAAGRARTLVVERVIEPAVVVREALLADAAVAAPPALAPALTAAGIPVIVTSDG